MIELSAEIKRIEYIRPENSSGGNEYLYIETADGKFRFTLSKEAIENDDIAQAMSDYDEMGNIKQMGDAIRLLKLFKDEGEAIEKMAIDVRLLVDKMKKFLLEKSIGQWTN